MEFILVTIIASCIMGAILNSKLVESNKLNRFFSYIANKLF